MKDVARNLDRWTHGIVARVFSQTTIDELAHWSNVPVINALSDLYHPCQALADVQTIKEHFGSLDGLKLAFVGDGNNVAHSLMLTAGRAGHACGGGDAERIRAERQRSSRRLSRAGPDYSYQRSGRGGRGAHAVYTDVWASMGQENEAAERAAAFAPYQVNEALFAQARPDAIFMHCLPAKRGEGSDRRGDGIAALGGVRSGGEPAARAESAAADAARLMLQSCRTLNQIYEQTKESSARLFGRAGYLHHHSVAEGELRLRSRRGVRRYRPGRR